MQLFFYEDDVISAHRTLDEAPDPRAFSMHAHERLELYCFLRGSGHFNVEGRRYKLREGDVLLMREAETHMLMISPDAPYERIAVHFDPELLRGLDPTLQLLRPFYDRPLGTRNRCRMGAVEDGFWRECLEKLTAEPSPDRTTLLAYLIPLLKEISRLAETAEDDPKTAGEAAPIVAYVNRHLFEPLSLAQLSGVFFMSQSQLNRVFRKATGSTAARYIEIKRLLAARSRIRQGEKPGEASRKCGFGDYSSFFRAYRAYFGASPSDDRSAAK